MQTLSEIEREAMKLPEIGRAQLASRLLNSLPAVLSDEDDGVAEALRRSAELAEDPGATITFEELKQTWLVLPRKRTSILLNFKSVLDGHRFFGKLLLVPLCAVT